MRNRTFAPAMGCIKHLHAKSGTMWSSVAHLKAIAEYSKRTVTYQSDTLNAFLGIFAPICSINILFTITMAYLFYLKPSRPATASHVLFSEAGATDSLLACAGGLTSQLVGNLVSLAGPGRGGMLLLFGVRKISKRSQNTSVPRHGGPL